MDLRLSSAAATTEERAAIDGVLGAGGDEHFADAGHLARGSAPRPYELSPECFSRNGFSRSIGAGKTIVELFEAPISSSVCR